MPDDRMHFRRLAAGVAAALRDQRCAVSAQSRQQRGGHFGRSFLVREQRRTWHHMELRIGKRTDHFMSPLNRKERIVFAPYELHRNVNPWMHLGELGDVISVEALQKFDCGISTRGCFVQRSEEELVEFAVEQ